LKVLERFGLTAERVMPLTGGSVNAHWRVTAGGTEYVLRRYNRRHDPAGTAYEHEVLRYLAGRGWPVAAPLPADDGRTVVGWEGERYALFPFLPGEPARYGNRDALRLKGRTLARLHRDLAAWSNGEQRPGWARVWDLDTFVRPDGHESFEALLELFGRTRADLAATLRDDHQANVAELRQLGYEGLPDTPIYFEFHLGNVLFADGAISALLDLDFVHLDSRVTDIGRSLSADCVARPPRNGLDPEAVRAWLGGYLVEEALTEAERRLVVPLIRANMLWLAALPLSIGMVSGDERMLQSAVWSAEIDLPALRRDDETLNEVVEQT
jgi:Ser/Thr protein kinase RdoA (MazF antagonist)